MSLLDIAEKIALTPVDDEDERLLRSLLTNLLRSLENGHLAAAALKVRLDTLVAEFDASPGDRNDLIVAYATAMELHGEEGHYGRPQELNYLELRAVTFQSDVDGKAGEFWLKDAAAAKAKAIADAFRRGHCNPEASVGRPGRPLWITPYDGEIKALLRQAKDPDLRDRDRSALANRIVAKLGLCHLKNGEGLLAFVTRGRIDSLSFERPDGQAALPVGPTGLEAGLHPRFRVWPDSQHDDPYGRTYDLDPSHRKNVKPDGHHGEREATRPGLKMAEFNECIYIGEIGPKDYVDADDEYLAAIKADRGSVDLLRELAAKVAS